VGILPFVKLCGSLVLERIELTEAAVLPGVVGSVEIVGGSGGRAEIIGAYLNNSQGNGKANLDKICKH
jgi:hypothetical protein